MSLVARVAVSSAASPNPIRIFLSANDQLILACDAKVDEATKHDMRYYKVDRAGVLIDSIYESYHGYWEQFIGEFIVYTNDSDGYYTTWPLDGDTARHEIIDLNPDLKWDQGKLKASINAIKETAKYWFFSCLSEEGVWYRKVYFYADRRWQSVSQKTQGYTDVEEGEGGSRTRKEVFRTGEYGFELPGNVELLYFHREEKMKYHHNIGGGASGFSVYNWRGKGFFQTDIADKDFQFMVPNLVVEKEKYNGFKPNLFIVPEPGSASSPYNPAFYHSPGGFAFYSPEPKQLFLIRLK